MSALAGLALVLHPDLYPRSWLMFGVVALPGIVTVIAALSEQLSPRKTMQYAISGLYTALLVRIGPFLVIPYSGIDQVSLYEIVRKTLASGKYAAPGGLYQSATQYPIGSTVIAAVSGLHPPSLRFASLIVAATFPWLLAALVYKAGEGGRSAIFAGVLGSYFPLLVRTSALIEAEYMSLLYFLVVLYLLVLVLRAPTRRNVFLLMFMLATSVLVHFFYSLAIVGIITISFVVHTVLSGQKRVNLRIVGALLVGGTVILTRILWSGYAETTVGMAVGSTVAAAKSSGGLLASFIPMSGTAASGAGTGGGQSLIMVVLKFVPLIVPLLLAAIGGLSMLRRKRSDPIVSVGIGVVVATIGLAVASGPSGKQFRAYYFVGLLTIGFGGIGASVLCNLGRWSAVRNIVAVGLIILFSVTAVIGPAAPMGNDVDPQFGGTSFAIPQDPATINLIEEFRFLSRSCDPLRKKTIDTGGYAKCSPPD
ncbi:hypothetical protein [Halococcus sediminicola]|uniref:hypothetical protein n=1 Tax=Halococcus sediminicola TaxID=1264579 RepID=UPI0012AB2F12|nr:hypothetical protein [Halococcus sediminicola]